MDYLLDDVQDLCEDLADKFREFSIAEYGIFKICLLSFGLLVGAFHARKVKRHGFLLFLAFVASLVYLLIRLFDDDEEYDFEDDEELAEYFGPDEEDSFEDYQPEAVISSLLEDETPEEKEE